MRGTKLFKLRMFAAVLAAATVGVLGLAVPAAATDPTPAVQTADVLPAPPKVEFVDGCDGTVKVTVVNGRKLPVRVRVGAESLTVGVDPKTLTVPGYQAGPVAVSVFLLGKWKPVAEHTWKLPENCRPSKPTVVVVAPTCDTPGAGVTVTNVNKAIVVKVRAGAGPAVAVEPGESHTFTVTASVWVRWGVKAAGLPLRFVRHVPPVCPTATPEPEPTVTAAPTPTATAGPEPTRTAPAQVPVGNTDDDGQGGLPITGDNTGVIVTVGALVLLAGAAGVLVTRKRRTRFTA